MVKDILAKHGVPMAGTVAFFTGVNSSLCRELAEYAAKMERRLPYVVESGSQTATIRALGLEVPAIPEISGNWDLVFVYDAIAGWRISHGRKVNGK